jgi:hypothetical protein
MPHFLTLGEFFVSEQETEKRFRREICKGLFEAGFFKQTTDTNRVINNFQTMLRYLNDKKAQAGESFMYFQYLFELSITEIERFQSSRARSFKALT